MGGGAPGGLRPWQSRVSQACSEAAVASAEPKRPRPLEAGGAQVESTWPGVAFPVLVGTSPRLDPLCPKVSLPGSALATAGAFIAPGISDLTSEYLGPGWLGF